MCTRVDSIISIQIESLNYWIDFHTTPGTHPIMEKKKIESAMKKANKSEQN
jgi:hypothetical protein